MGDYIVRRGLTHEQTWIIRDLSKRGELVVLHKAKEYGVDTKTIRARLRVTAPYPEFETQEHARICDALQNWSRS